MHRPITESSAGPMVPIIAMSYCNKGLARVMVDCSCNFNNWALCCVAVALSLQQTCVCFRGVNMCTG